MAHTLLLSGSRTVNVRDIMCVCVCVWCVQSVTHSALTASGKLAYWSQRYTVRRRQAAPSTAPAATPPTQPSTAPDVPDFLAALTDKILTTGEYEYSVLGSMRLCASFMHMHSSARSLQHAHHSTRHSPLGVVMRLWKVV